MSEPPAGLTIRDAHSDDHERVAELTVAAYRHPLPHLGEYADELRDVAGHVTTARVFVAAVDGEIVGAVTYVPGPGPLSEWDDPRAAGIRFLAVAPEAQGRGIGRALVVACIELARREGRERLILHTTDVMTTAQRIYDRLGFVRDTSLDDEPEPGLWLRAYRLELT